MVPPVKTLVAFSTYWGSRQGGLNSFNRDLLSAFAGLAYETVSTICIVLNATEIDIASAAGEQISLISLGLDTKSFGAELESKAWGCLQKAGHNLDPLNTAWLGHDRITGGIAIAAARMRGGRSVLINHMSYGSYEAFAEHSSLASRKEAEQKALFKDADVVLAVGPLLRDTLSDLIDAEHIGMLIPGLPEITAKRAPKTFKAFISGRLSEDARKIKQAQLGVAAFAAAIKLADLNAALPDTLRGENEPKLTLRGVDLEDGNGSNQTGTELELRLFAERYAGRAFTLHALPFTTNRAELYEELASASLAMMPSWHEGFGLVAWEAVGAGVPLIVSKKSGVYRLLNDFDDGVLIPLLNPVDISGTSEEPYFLEKDLNSLTQEIIRVAKDPAGARKRAVRLRQVLAERFTWAECGREFARAIGWQLSLRETFPHQPTISTEPCQDKPESLRLLELPRSAWKPNAGMSDSQLLRAEEQIVPFDHARQPFLAEQIAWATDVTYPISIRLLTGAGGVGKTRLAIELCVRLQHLGFEAGFLRGDQEDVEIRELAQKLAGTDKHSCVVIDYAETRQATLLALLRNLMEHPVHRGIHVLLLARDGGGWWNMLASKDPLCESLLEGAASTGPFELPFLHSTENDRRAAYKVALLTFAHHLGATPPAHEPQLDEAHFAHPLFIQMAALISLSGERPKSAEALTRTLVSHERRYWRKALAFLGAQSEYVEDQAALLMVLSTFANGVATARELDDLWHDSGGDRALLKQVFSCLAPLYPGRQGLEAWRPDLLGEALIAQILLTETGPQVLGAVFGKGNQAVRRSTFTVLSRVLRNRADVIQVVEDSLPPFFVRCANEIVTACIELPGPLAQIAENVYLKLPQPLQWQAAGILDKYLKFDLFVLSGLDVLVSKTLVSKAEKVFEKKKAVDTSFRYATALNNLSVALSRDGQDDAAVSTAESALEIRRKLAAVDPIRFDEPLASTLSGYSNALEAVGRTAAATAAALESLNIRERLAKAHPGKYDQSLATSLTSYSNCLAELGKADEAFEVCAKALEITRRLVQSSSGDFREDLAIDLGNYATSLGALGRSDDALVAIKESLDIHVILAAEKPERFENDLARSLSHYADCLAKKGDSAAALTASKQALEIRQRLAQAKPARFEGSLANTMDGYAARLSENGDVNGGKQMSTCVIEIRKRLAASNAAKHLDELAVSLCNHAVHCAETGDFDKALDVDRQAIAIRRVRASERAERYEGELALSLTNYSNHLANCGQWGEAVEQESEAVQLFQKCAARIPRRYLSNLRQSKYQLAFWKWLETGRNVGEIDGASYDAGLMPHDDYLYLRFVRESISALIAPGIASIQSALAAWTDLNKTQQTECELSYIALAILAQKHWPEAELGEWNIRLENYQRQTCGRLPMWIVETLRRAETALPTPSIVPLSI
jgi:glycosyltransferase involved in cell wall biosynthesis